MGPAGPRARLLAAPSSGLEGMRVPDAPQGPPSGSHAASPECAPWNARAWRGPAPNARLKHRAIPADALDAMSSASEPTVACDEARADLGVFLERGLDPARSRAMRAHLGDCPDCALVYRERAEAAARAVRRRRTERELPAAPGPRPPAGLFGFLPFGRASARGARIRSLVLPALFVALFTTFGTPGRVGARLQLEWIDGDVRAAGRALGTTLVELPVRRGHWCATGSTGRARIVAPGATAWIEPLSLVLVEAVAGPRLRVERGALRLVGRALVTTPAGIAQADGAVALAFDGATLSIACESGEATLINAAGERQMRAGEHIEIDLLP